MKYFYPIFSLNSFQACSNNRFDDSLKLFDSAINLGLQPSVHNFSPLLKSCGSPKKARELLKRMDFVGVESNVISFTAAIKSCEKSGDWQGALEILDLMRMCDITPNEVTYSCLINAASQGSAGAVAVNLLREMQMNGYSSNMFAYASTLVACARSGMWNEVDSLLSEMIRFYESIPESVLISVINICRDKDRNPSSLPNWSRALWLIEKWARKVTDATDSLYTMAMDVCESAFQFDTVIAIYQIMVRNIFSSIAFILFLQVYLLLSIM